MHKSDFKRCTKYIYNFTMLGFSLNTLMNIFCVSKYSSKLWFIMADMILSHAHTVL